MTLQKKYKTTKEQREYQKKWYRENIDKCRAYKQKQMKERRADPEINERIKKKTREWYKRTNGAEKQRKYIKKLKTENFFKWRTRLFFQHYGVRYTEADFKNKWDKQNGECYFTGRKLDNTAHIDHILPIKRGGTHELDNLRWVCKEANYGKRDMTDGEYLNVIRDIMERLI